MFEPLLLVCPQGVVFCLEIPSKARHNQLIQTITEVRRGIHFDEFASERL